MPSRWCARPRGARTNPNVARTRAQHVCRSALRTASGVSRRRVSDVRAQRGEISRSTVGHTWQILTAPLDRARTARRACRAASGGAACARCVPPCASALSTAASPTPRTDGCRGLRWSARVPLCAHTAPQADVCSPLRSTEVLPAAIMKKAAVLISVAAALALASPPASFVSGLSAPMPSPGQGEFQRLAGPARAQGATKRALLTNDSTPTHASDP